MKIADRPPYFIDPPVLSREEEEENRLCGYTTPDIPGPGKEPLRAGDIIRFIKYPTNDCHLAQITEINSFEQHMEESIPILRLLNESYPIQLYDSIVRLYTMNYRTGELEDNKKWAHSHPLADFQLVQSVVCAKTRKEIQWNRRGKQSVLQGETLNDMVCRLHAHAENDLTRAFLTVQPMEQQLTHNKEDCAKYDDLLDICFKEYHECERSKDIEEVVVDAGNLEEIPDPKKISDLDSIASTLSPNRPSSPSSDGKSNLSYNSKCDSVLSSSESATDAPDAPSVDDCPILSDVSFYESSSLDESLSESSLSDKSSPELSSSDESSSDDSKSCAAKKNVHKKKTTTSWNNPVATFNSWKIALRKSKEMEQSDWYSTWQNNEEKLMKCVTHKDCAREMKIVRSKDQTGATIYMRGTHGTTVSDEPFIGKGKIYNGSYTILYY